MQLLELTGTLPNILILGVDDNGNMVFANDVAKSSLFINQSQSSNQPVDQLIQINSDWKKITDNAGRFSQEVMIGGNKKNASAILEVFRLQIEADSVIQYAFIIDLKSREAANKKALDLSLEHQSSIQTLNKIIGYANMLMKQEGDRHTQQFANYISEMSWEMKEVSQGSVLSKIKSLPQGYDLIDFKEIFAEALHLKRLGLDMVDISIDAEAEPVIFFSHPHHLQTLITELTKHFFLYTATRPLKLSFRVNGSDTGVIVRAEGHPVNHSKEGFLNDIVLTALQEINGSVERVEKDKETVILELKIPTS